MTETNWALKEWAIAVQALLAGDLILLIRKGGIREAKSTFDVPSDRGLLFPTYEHQQQAALRSPYRERLVPHSVPTVGDELRLAGWAQITHQFPLSPDTVAPLQPFHIWTEAWFAERLAWKPERPAYGLLLRVHRFAHPLVLPYQARYGGCRSWITLDVAPPWPDSTPVLSAAAYTAQVEQIQGAIAAITPPD